MIVHNIIKDTQHNGVMITYALQFLKCFKYESVVILKFKQKNLFQLDRLYTIIILSVIIISLL